MNHPDHPPTASRALLIAFVVAPLVFLLLIGKRDIATSHEARVAQTSRQMSAVGWPWSDSARVEVPVVGLVEHKGDRRLGPLPREGKMTVNPWLVPVINGQIRLQKPPLPYWCAAVVFSTFGIGEGWARLVPALLGATMTMLIADLARLILGRRAMLPAAVVWMTTVFIVDEFRKSMADPYLGFFTLCCLWTWMRGGRGGAIAFYVSLGLGMLAKGPPLLVPVIPALMLARFAMGHRPRASWIAHLIGGAVFLAIALPWPAYVLSQVHNAWDLWRYELDNVEKARPWWRYIGTVIAVCGWWTPAWLGGLVLAFLHLRDRGISSLRAPRNRRRGFAIGWLAIVVVFYSVKAVKKDAYLLPVVPAITLTVADSIAMMLAWSRRQRSMRGMPAVLALAHAAIAIGFSAAMLVLCWRMSVDRAAGVVLAGVTLLTALAAALSIRRHAPQWFGAQGFAYAMCAVLFVGFYLPDADNRRSPKRFARAVYSYVTESGVPLWRDQLPEDATFYLPLDVPTTDDADINGSSRVIVLVDDGRRDIDRGRLNPDSSFFAAYVGDVPIVQIRRLPITDDGNGRWKAYELTLDRKRV